MKIALLHNGHHWKSYSIVRSLVEELSSRFECSIIHKGEDAKNFDLVFIIGQPRTLPIKNDNKFVVCFGLSDPGRFYQKLYDQTDVYATIDYNMIGQDPKNIYFPPFCDPEYFYPVKVQKRYDCVFIGSGWHPTSQNRVEVVTAIREQGYSVLTAGYRWPEHKDSIPFVSGRKLIKCYCLAKVSIDLTSDIAPISSRIFQAMACGTPTITPLREDKVGLFEPNELIYSFRDKGSKIIDPVAFLLTVESALKQDLTNVSLKGRKACLSKHMVKHRVDCLIKHLKSKELI